MNIHLRIDHCVSPDLKWRRDHPSVARSKLIHREYGVRSRARFSIPTGQYFNEGITKNIIHNTSRCCVERLAVAADAFEVFPCTYLLLTFLTMLIRVCMYACIMKLNSLSLFTLMNIQLLLYFTVLIISAVKPLLKWLPLKAPLLNRNRVKLTLLHELINKQKTRRLHDNISRYYNI